MFYIIGLGLGDQKDISIKGLEIVRKCATVYLESYTSILTCGVHELEKFYDRKIIIADRELVEQGADTILDRSDKEDVALLVVGDPFGATTHTDLILRAKEQGIKVEVVHNASIINAVGCTGLQLYSFGETVSIPYWESNWQPDSFFEKILRNYVNKMHTLCLLDIKVKEPTMESIMKREKEYMPPKFMSAKEASNQLLQIIDKYKSTGKSSDITDSNLCVGVARVGSESQKIVACSLKDMSEVDLGKPLHSLVIPGPDLHPLELEFLEQFKI